MVGLQRFAHQKLWGSSLFPQRRYLFEEVTVLLGTGEVVFVCFLHQFYRRLSTFCVWQFDMQIFLLLFLHLFTKWKVQATVLQRDELPQKCEQHLRTTAFKNLWNKTWTIPKKTVPTKTWKMKTLKYCTLPETNSSHLKMDGWNTTVLLRRPIFRCYVSFREGKSIRFSPKIPFQGLPGALNSPYVHLRLGYQSQSWGGSMDDSQFFQTIGKVWAIQRYP